MQGKHVIENLSLLFVVIAREHVGTQGTLVREHVDTQDTLACEHVSTQGTQFSRLISDIFLFNILSIANCSSFWSSSSEFVEILY